MTEQIYLTLDRVPVPKDDPQARLLIEITTDDSGEVTKERTVLLQSGLGSELKVHRSVTEMAGDYREILSGLTDDIIRGESWRSAASQFKATIREYAEEAYLEGLRDGGVENPEDELDETDQAAIQDWIAGQLPYVKDFLQWVEQERDGGVIQDRLSLWTAAIEALGAQGRMSAQRNMMVEWQLGETEHHCETCARLDGTRHRMSWFNSRGYIPREPGSETLECGGWRCDCKLIGPDGEQVI